MCGIAGFIGVHPLNEHLIRTTLLKMKNRGPDAQLSFSDSVGSVSVALLHSRLSIIDLDERAHQPFKIGNYVLVFNGEIYNYKELRCILESKGIRFRTNSDTEVLLQSYIAKGEDCVNDFEGMWAFAIYDRKRNVLFLSRDRFGEKPLYYAQTEEGFYFGSEVKFLEALSGKRFDINEQQIMRYLVNGFRSLYKKRETFFKGVHEIPAAVNAIVDEKIGVKVGRYWTIPAIEQKAMAFNDAVEGFRQKLFESVRLRLRADTPLAFCLSGGVDSAALVSIAVKKFGYDASTFSILDGDERYNEYENIKATVEDLGCRHTLITLRRQGVIDRLKKLVLYHDAPVYTISYYIHSLISESVSRQGYRVAIMGTGADELVTGYYDHFLLHLAEMQGGPKYFEFLNDWQTHISDIVRNPHLRNPELFIRNPKFRDYIYLDHLQFASFLKNEFYEEFAEVDYTSNHLRNRMLNELFYEIVPVVLHEDDLNSMFYSVENRSPYLDSRLFQFALTIPDEYLIRHGYAKAVLREAVSGILNDQVRLDRHKKGFNASILSLIDFQQKSVKEYLLDNSPVFDFIEKSKIENLFRLTSVPNSISKFLFYFVNVKIFLETRQRAHSFDPGQEGSAL